MPRYVYRCDRNDGHLLEQERPVRERNDTYLCNEPAEASGTICGGLLKRTWSSPALVLTDGFERRA